MRHKEQFKKGTKIGQLTYIKETESEGLKRRAIFKCRCGVIFETRINSAKFELTISCGCLRGKFTHGKSGTAEYNIWNRIKDRCSNLKDKRYGGRGIEMCEEWVEDYIAFFSYMGERPSSLHSIERIDNNGNYEPGNCRWATKKEQARNRVSNVFVTYKGEHKCINEWAEILNMNQMTLWSRIFRYKWGIEKSFTHPKREPRNLNHLKNKT